MSLIFPDNHYHHQSSTREWEGFKQGKNEKILLGGVDNDDFVCQKPLICSINKVCLTLNLFPMASQGTTKNEKMENDGGKKIATNKSKAPR